MASTDNGGEGSPERGDEDIVLSKCSDAAGDGESGHGSSSSSLSSSSSPLSGLNLLAFVAGEYSDFSDGDGDGDGDGRQKDDGEEEEGCASSASASSSSWNEDGSSADSSSKPTAVSDAPAAGRSRGDDLRSAVTKVRRSVFDRLSAAPYSSSSPRSSPRDVPIVVVDGRRRPRPRGRRAPRSFRRARWRERALVTVDRAGTGTRTRTSSSPPPPPSSVSPPTNGRSPSPSFHPALDEWFRNSLAAFVQRVTFAAVDAVAPSNPAATARANVFRIDPYYCSVSEAADRCRRLHFATDDLYAASRDEYRALVARQRDFVRRGTLVQLVAAIDQMMTYAKYCSAVVGRRDVILSPVDVARERVDALFAVLLRRHLTPLAGVSSTNAACITAEQAARSPIVRMARGVGLLGRAYARKTFIGSLLSYGVLQEFLAEYVPGSFLKEVMQEVCMLLADPSTPSDIRAHLLCEVQANYAGGLFFQAC